MSSRFLRTALVLVTSLFTLSNAQAGFITGEIYLDGDRARWEYIGAFDLLGGKLDSDGVGKQEAPKVGEPDALALNGLEAASFLFGIDASELAVAAFLDNDAAANNFLVNHTAWYDLHAPTALEVLPVGQTEEERERLALVTTFQLLDENIVAEFAGTPPGLYDEIGDASAWIQDRARVTFNFQDRTTVNVADKTNFVFQRVTEVPEPSSLAIFALGFLGLGARRLFTR